MAPMHDLVIKNALVFDGSKAPGRHASLAVADGCITAIGRDVGPGRREIDADGLALAPGIIDSHTHYDAQITWDAGLHPSPELGVTTVVIGNCGFTIAPCRPEHRDITMRNLTHVEGMSLDVLRSGIRWEFETFPEYLALLERLGSVPNASSARRSAPAPWASPPRRRRSTMARAARRCRRGSPTRPSCARLSARWARPGAASSC